MPRTEEGRLKRGEWKALTHEEQRTLINSRRRVSRAADPRKTKSEALKSRYDITIEEYDAMLEKQGGVCAICKGPPGAKSYHVDHDHATGRVRGLLCNPCNRALGYFKDRADVMQRAVEYLR